MSADRLFSVAEFMDFSGLTRDAVYHYDRIGLLSPAQRTKRGDRLYSKEQLATVNVIQILQKLGMPLSGIKKTLTSRTPHVISELLFEQTQIIDDSIEQLMQARRLLYAHQRAIQSVSRIDEGAIVIRALPERRIVLGPPNDYSGGKNDYDALKDFYIAMRARHPSLELSYPVWARFSAERICRGDWTFPDRYYFYNPGGPDRTPAGYYAVGYSRGGYGNSDGLYKQMLAYIEENGCELCGDTYEEYPLNELCVADDTNYLRRVIMHVRKKEDN